jgi:hypothetical protein
MKLRVVPASRGLSWVQQGLGLCIKQPMGLVSLLGLILTLAMLLWAFQIIGLIIAVMAMPLFWMSFMLAARRVTMSERTSPAVLIEPLRDPTERMAWLKLGAMYALGVVAVSLLASALGPSMEALSDAVEAASKSDVPTTDPVILQSVLWRVALSLPLSLAFWHTPALIHWAKVPPVKALFFSVVASWRNLGAFVVYGACWLAVLGAGAAVVQVISAIAPDSIVSTLVVVFTGMWIAAAFYSSLYFSVTDCFEPPEGALQESRETPSKGQA